MISRPDWVQEFISHVLEVPSLKKMPLNVFVVSFHYLVVSKVPNKQIHTDAAIIELIQNFHRLPPDLQFTEVASLSL